MAANVTSVVVAALALKYLSISSHLSPPIYILIGALFIAAQFLYFTHRFKPVAGTISIIVLILSILLLRYGLGNVPFPINPSLILSALIALQIIKLPIG